MERKSKLAERRKRRKQRKKELRKENKLAAERIQTQLNEEKPNVTIEYVTSLPTEDPLYDMYADVFTRFDPSHKETPEEEMLPETEETPVTPEPQNTLTRKKKKELRRVGVAKLKQVVQRPDLVDTHDCNSPDPLLLIDLKNTRNSIPVPAHWKQKRKYLQGKRGFAKPPFRLPPFIEDTGISQLRQVQLNADEHKSAQQKARERMAPKMGKMNIDYQVLHDAFFRYQTKPRLSQFSELYYEGKEFHVQGSDKRVGNLSYELRDALGMRENGPVPWLFNMQRYGPPPAYPKLKIPGLNAPLPPGATFGFSDGQWGRPPVDSFGNPLYGDPFGWYKHAVPPPSSVDRRPWGEVLEVEDLEDEELNATPATEETFMEDFPSVEEAPAVASIAAGLETPDTLDLRKRGLVTPQRPLYEVLEPQKAEMDSAMLGSAYTYDLAKKQ